MPRRDFNRFKHRFNKWHKHEFEEERHVDGVGDQLRVTTTYGHRRDHGVSGRRSFPSDMIRRAMAMNLLPVPSGSSPSSQNSGLGLGEIWARITIIYGISYPFNVLQELVNTAFGTQLRFYNACVEGRNAVMYAKVRQKQLLSYRKALQSIRDPSSDKTLVGDITQAFEPRLPSTPHTSAPGSSTLSNTLPEPWLEALRRCFLERFQSTTRCLDLSSLHTDPTLLSQGLYLPLNRATVVRALVSILRDNAAQLSLLNLSNNRLTQMNAFSLLACDTHGSTMVTIERIDLSCNPLGGFAALAGLQGIAGLIELDISETPLSVKFQLTDRAMAA